LFKSVRLGRHSRFYTAPMTVSAQALYDRGFLRLDRQQTERTIEHF
jgi:hypothetical protein